MTLRVRLYFYSWESKSEQCQTPSTMTCFRTPDPFSAFLYLTSPHVPKRCAYQTISFGVCLPYLTFMIRQHPRYPQNLLVPTLPPSSNPLRSFTSTTPRPSRRPATTSNTLLPEFRKTKASVAKRILLLYPDNMQSSSRLGRWSMLLLFWDAVIIAPRNDWAQNNPANPSFPSNLSLPESEPSNPCPANSHFPG